MHQNRSPVKILVIDDEEAIRKGCVLAFSEQGYKVDTAADGKQGLASMRADDPDLVFLDMKLPDADGMELLRILHKEKPRLLVVVMTGYSSVENAVSAMKLGAFDYLSKPFTDDELLRCAEKALEKMRLTEENLSLRKQLSTRFEFNDIVGENPRILKIFEEIRKAAPTETTVLLEGESGTGKELFAKAIHAQSRRAARQFVVVDCSTFSSSLLETELFGHVKGAFTGATSARQGVFEIANGGTLFLDEVANLTLEVQSKLLRIMDTGEYKPVGAGHTKKTDMRIIAATNRDLKSMVEEKLFRKDLFYRLNVLPIYLPPLRERRDDIPRLAYHFLRFFCREAGRRIEGFSDEALEVLKRYDWPGNVRQLKNVVERLVVMAEETILDYPQLVDNLHGGSSHPKEAIPETWEELKAAKKRILDVEYGRVEKAFLLKAMETAEGNITRAAQTVGIQRSNFSSLLKRHGIAPRPAP